MSESEISWYRFRATIDRCIFRTTEFHSTHCLVALQPPIKPPFSNTNTTQRGKRACWAGMKPGRYLLDAINNNHKRCIVSFVIFHISLFVADDLIDSVGVGRVPYKIRCLKPMKKLVIRLPASDNLRVRATRAIFPPVIVSLSEYLTSEVLTHRGVIPTHRMPRHFPTFQS